MRKDVIYALRTLRRSPMFTAVAVVSLALGIGANTAIFSLLNQVVLRSLPVRDPENLVLLHTEYMAPGQSSSDNFETVFSNPMYRALRDRDPAFSGMIARMGTRVTAAYNGNADTAEAEMVSGNFFNVLGVEPALGRTLVPDDDGAAGAHPVVMLSYAYWSSRFGRKPDILNQTITINGHPMVVVGVVSPKFVGMMPGSAPNLYLPIAMKRAATPTWDGLEDPKVRWLNLFGRLRPGWKLARAQAATDVAYRAILETELAAMGTMRTERARDEFLNHRVELRPAAQGINDLRRRWEKPLTALMAMVGLVLLIACANVASLMLARAGGRRREIAIRLALGAGRSALIRQLLTEGLVLAIAGGILGLVVASWSTDTLIRLLPSEQTHAWLSPAIDIRLLGFTLALAMVSGVAFAVIPAWQATRPDVAETLKNQATSVTTGGGPARFRKAIVTAQVALSLLLLVGAGLFTTSFMRLMNVDLGFRSERLMMFTLDTTPSRHGEVEAAAFYRDVERRLRAAGGVMSVAAADGGPFSGSNRSGNITVEGYQAKENENMGATRIVVSPGYFRGMGVPLRAGREFTERDTAGAPKVAVINEAFAKRYFAGRNPIGRHFMFGASNKPNLDREIVGVAADVRPDVRNPAKETVFTPYEQWEKPSQLTFYVRGVRDETQLASTIRQLVRSMDANVPVSDLNPVDLEVRNSIYSDRLIAILSASFGVLATLLAAIGLYGVVAYGVARRTPEIGVRVALGAAPVSVLKMVLAEAARTTGVGIVLGLLAAFALSRYVESQLFGVKAADPAVFGSAAVLLAMVALAAAFVPGRKASKIDPMRALKYE